MQNNAPRLLIAGTGSGCGKTTVTSAVLRALQRRGAALAAFSPVSSISPAFTRERGGDVGLASSWNTIAIILSLLCMTGVLLVWG